MNLMVKDLMSDLEVGNRGEEIIKERSKNPFVPVNQFMGVAMGTGTAQSIPWKTYVPGIFTSGGTTYSNLGSLTGGTL